MWKGQKIIQVYNKKISKLKVLKGEKKCKSIFKNCMLQGKYGKGI
jgi:hypothetical protein